MTNKNPSLRAAWRDLTDEEVKKLPQTSDKAHEVDSMYYYNAVPCPNEHLAVRYTESRCCVVCQADSKKRQYYKNKLQKITKSNLANTQTIEFLGIKMNFLLSENKE